MVITDIVFSAYVGGSTGKSLFTHMRTAYRLSNTNKPITIAVIDTSHGAALYETMGVLFDRRPHDVSRDRDVGYGDCYVFDDNKKKVFYAFRPKRQFIPSAQELFKMFSTVRDFFKDEGKELDYLICETNLPPKELMDEAESIKSIAGLWQNHKINLWSTWNTAALLNEHEYTVHNNVCNSTKPLGIEFYYVHNPFSTIAGAPEGPISEAMKKCYDLPPTEVFYDPITLRNSCWDKAHDTALSIDVPNEEIWKSAYLNFKERPRNLLPIYRRSKNWGRVYLTRYRSKDANKGKVSYRVSDEKSFTDIIDDVSEKLYSEIFFPYFRAIEDTGLSVIS